MDATPADGGRRLPFGSEFSPDQISLPTLLDLAAEHGGDTGAFDAAVRGAYFERRNISEANRRKLAMNTRLSMRAYGIIDRESRLTDFGRRLYEERGDEDALHADLARHILRDLNGILVLQCVQDMSAAGEPATLVELRRWLDQRGVRFPSGGRHASTLRLWLEKAGVVDGRWRINEQRLGELLGSTIEDIEALAMLSDGQRAFLKALLNMGSAAAHWSNDVARLAETTYGVRFNEKALARQVLYPLAKGGFITLERGTREAGHGAKPSRVTATDKLQDEVAAPLLAQMEGGLAGDLRALLRLSLATILERIGSEDRHVRGLALEALAFKLMRLIDLGYVGTRLRGDATGGAEVDLIFESSRLVYSRWQVQCKNTRSVSLDDVAKEVGLTHLLKSNVVVMVSTGDIGPEARTYANRVMMDSNLAIVMVDRADVSALAERPAAIVDVLHREAGHAMTIKKIEL